MSEPQNVSRKNNNRGSIVVKSILDEENACFPDLHIFLHPAERCMNSVQENLAPVWGNEVAILQTPEAETSQQRSDQ